MKKQIVSKIVIEVLKLLWTIVYIGFVIYFLITRNNLGMNAVTLVYSFVRLAVSAIRDARKNESESPESEKPVKDKRSAIGAVLFIAILAAYILICKIWPVTVVPATILLLTVAVILHIFDFISAIRK